MAEHPPLLLPVPPASCVDDSSQSSEDEAAPCTGQLFPDAPRCTGEPPDEKASAPLTGPLISQALLSTAPQPRKGQQAIAPIPTAAHDILVQKAIHCGAPIKVSMSTACRTFRNPALDPSMPAKKRPILSDAALGAQVQDHLRSLERGVPVKKRINPWLIAEPLTVLPAAPR
jgi:hypothetical protein